MDLGMGPVVGPPIRATGLGSISAAVCARLINRHAADSFLVRSSLSFGTGLVRPFVQAQGSDERRLTIFGDHARAFDNSPS